MDGFLILSPLKMTPYGIVPIPYVVISLAPNDNLSVKKGQVAIWLNVRRDLRQASRSPAKAVIL